MVDSPSVGASTSRRSRYQGYEIESRAAYDGHYWYAMFLVRGPADVYWMRHLCQTRHETEDAAHSVALQTARLAIKVKLDRF